MTCASHKRRVIAVICLSMCVAGAGPLRAASASSIETAPGPLSPTLKAAGFQWGDHYRFAIGGVPVQALEFTAPLSLPEAAAALATHSTHLQRVIATPHGILLSGLRRAAHWVAQLSPHGTGVRGVVSSIPWPLPPQFSQRSPASVVGWLQTHNTLRFQVSSETQEQVVQEVHRSPWTAQAFEARMTQGLRRDGWQRTATGPALPGASHWRRNSDSLAVVVHPDTQGSQALVHRVR